jgi:hypothetical protein
MTGPKIHIRDFKLQPDVTGLAEAVEGEGGDDDNKGVVGHNGGEGVDAGSEVLGVFEFGGWETLEGEFVVSGAVCGGGGVFEFVVCVYDEGIDVDDVETVLDGSVLDVILTTVVGGSDILVRLWNGSYETVISDPPTLREMWIVVAKPMFAGNVNVYPWASQLLEYCSYC